LYVNLSDEKIIQKILSEIDQMYNGLATQSYVSGVVQNWANEPFVKASYSEYPWSKIWPMKVLKKPIKQRIFFAGEHLPMALQKWHWGFVHGAAYSGRDAADQVLNQIM
jgi:monoamine oxidase